MSNIITLGETVLDIMFRNGVPVAAKPGGAVLNTAVSLGRLGLPVHFISEYSTDEVGNFVNKFLNKNGVDTSSVYRYQEGRTSLALAFLDENSNASYSFYKQYPAERLEISLPQFKSDDLFVFGSFYAISSEIRHKLLLLIKAAKKSGAIIFYDPNFRKTHLHELDQLQPVLMENFHYASIVRGSDEDFAYILDARDAASAYKAIGKKDLTLVYTSNTQNITLITPCFTQHYDIQQVRAVSTIGAGDTFNAGLIYGLFKNGIKMDQLPSLSESVWGELIHIAVEFATAVCMSYENYIPAEVADKYKITGTN